LVLAATLYPYAMTAHSLFKFPVVEEHERDIENPPSCKLMGTKRLELLQAANWICWDEYPSNHKEILEDVVKWLPTLFVTPIGDIRQVNLSYKIIIIFLCVVNINIIIYLFRL